MEIGCVFKNQLGSYDVLSGFEQKGKKKKMVTKRFGDHILKGTRVNLEHMSASEALERIMDICGIGPDDKFQIRHSFNVFSRPKKENK